MTGGTRRCSVAWVASRNASILEFRMSYSGEQMPNRSKVPSLSRVIGQIIETANNPRITLSAGFLLRTSLMHDLTYVDEWSLAPDLRILTSTLSAVLHRFAAA